MESDLTSRLPVGQHIKNMRTVLGLLWELDHTQFPAAAAKAAAGVTAGYLELYLSAQVLNAVVEKAAFEKTMRMAVILLGLIFFCRVAESFWGNRLEIKREITDRRYELLVSKKLLQMDFSLVDSPVLVKIKAFW